MTPDELKIVIESAFAPLRCVVSIWDYGEKIRFAVFKGDEMLAHAGDDRFGRGDTLIPIRNTDQIKMAVEVLQERIISQGHDLHPWEWPKGEV